MTTATLDYKNGKTIRVARSMCLESLKFYTQYFFLHQYKRKFVWNEHHQVIVEALEEVLLGKLNRLIINLAPRYGKTELAVKSFISYGLALNPAAKFIHLSYGDDIALDNSEMIKDLLESESYQDLFPGMTIKRDSKAKNKWYTTQGGGLLARSAGGQVTGFGAGLVDEEIDSQFEIMDYADTIGRQTVNSEQTDLERKLLFAGAIVIDDPIKPEDADQDIKRNRVNSRFDSTIRNRVNSRNTPIILIGHRLHPEDLAGYLQRPEEADEWRVISLPCIKKDGTALWPFKHTIEELHSLKKANEIVFERQYQQDPQPKFGLMFPIQELNFFDSYDEEEVAHTSLFGDPANLGGDDFAGIVAKLIGNKIHITWVLYNTDGEDANSMEVCNEILEENPSYVGIEGVFGWAETYKIIRDNVQMAGFKNEMRCLKPRTNKHVRISSRQSFIRNHFVFDRNYQKKPQYYKFMKNLTSYLKIQEPGKVNKHDEAPDVCEMAAKYYLKTFPSLWPLETILKQNEADN